MRRSRLLPPLAALSMLTLAATTAPATGAATLADPPERTMDSTPRPGDTAERPDRAVAARYPLPDAVTFPEGIAALPDGTFVVGSTTDGSLTRLWPDGATEPFAPAGQLGRTTAVGLAADAEGRVYVAGGTSGIVSVLDADGTPRRALRAPGEPSEGFLNDVAISDDGWGYATDSRRPVIYRFSTDDGPPTHGGDAADGQLEAWLDLSGTPLAYEEGFNLNGIVVSESGSFLVTVQSNTGALWRIATADGTVERIDTDGVSFEGGDGLVLVNPAPSEPHDARPTLFVVQNAASTITRLALDPAGRWTDVTGTVRTDELRFPTTAALDDDRLLVVNGQLDQRQGEPVTPFDVTATPLATFDGAGPRPPGDGKPDAACDADDGGLTLPEGLCASVFADGLVGARHLTVADDGTVYTAIADAPDGDPDGGDVGRCADLPEPAVTFPAHWAPLGMTFPTVDALGQRYRDGAFIAFHGSRFDPADQPEGPGYVVAFVPFDGGMATGGWEVFADGFAGTSTDLPADAEHRVVDVAEGPDGALYLSDDVGGRIWRITRQG